MSQKGSARSTGPDSCSSKRTPIWLSWARRLQAIAQNGITYGNDAYDLERYEAIQEIVSEMVGTMSEEEPERVRELLSRELGPATPKVDVRAAIFSENEILLVRERGDGLWTLPGGWVDVEEPPSRAVEREVREESGLHCSPERLLAVWDKNLHGHPPSLYHTYKLVFLCRVRGGRPKPGLETSAVGFFSESDLPPLSSERTTRDQVVRLFEMHRTPTGETEFD